MTSEQRAELGFKITYEDKSKLKFLMGQNTITYFPYTGWGSGKGIQDGRGLQHLLGQLQKIKTTVDILSQTTLLPPDFGKAL